MTTAPQPVAIIPARAGSKGLPGKNTRLLAGKPLYRHSVDRALASGIKRVIISTDIADIFTHDLPDEVELFQRPPKLAGDAVTMAEMLRNLLPQANLTNHTIVLMQPTSPLRTTQTVQRALTLYRKTPTCSLLMSVSEAERSVLKWGTLKDNRFIPLSSPDYCFANRQQLPAVVRPNGAIYIFSSARFLEDGDFSAEDILALPIPEREALDIDIAEDFERCAALLDEGNSQ